MAGWTSLCETLVSSAMTTTTGMKMAWHVLTNWRQIILCLLLPRLVSSVLWFLLFIWRRSRMLFYLLSLMLFRRLCLSQFTFVFLLGMCFFALQLFRFLASSIFRFSLAFFSRARECQRLFLFNYFKAQSGQTFRFLRWLFSPHSSFVPSHLLHTCSIIATHTFDRVRFAHISLLIFHLHMFDSCGW